MTKRTVDVFSAGCYVCEEAVRIVKETACGSCDVQVHDVRTDLAKAKAQSFGIARLPAVVVDGKIADCCLQGPVDAGRLRALGVGTA